MTKLILPPKVHNDINCIECCNNNEFCCTKDDYKDCVNNNYSMRYDDIPCHICENLYQCHIEPAYEFDRLSCISRAFEYQKLICTTCKTKLDGCEDQTCLIEHGSMYTSIAEEDVKYVFPTKQKEPNTSISIKSNTQSTVECSLQYIETNEIDNKVNRGVYLVTNGEQVKIGYSNDIKKRISNLQTANSKELKLLGVVPGNTGLEALFHTKYKSLRVRGEWFNLSSSEVEEILFINQVFGAVSYLREVT